MSPQTLIGLENPSATFKPGKSALGHHWLLQDGDGQEVGRTKYFYQGAGKSLGRVMRATGLSTHGVMRAHVLGADGEELYRVHSTSGKDSRVELTRPDGTPIGAARRRKLSLELVAPPSDTIVGVIERSDKEEMAFPVLDAHGERIAILSTQKIELAAPSISEMVFMPRLASDRIAFQATMHFGFAGAEEYHLHIERAPTSEPLRTLLALAPVLAAYAY
jgi:hypothetical protein